MGMGALVQMMEISQAGLDLIAKFEGLRLTAYLDIAGVLTIGYGSTHGVLEGQTITQEQAMQLLRQDAASASQCVSEATEGLNPSQRQFDALTSFCFNLGCGSLRLMLSHGWAEVPNQIVRWNRAGGVVVPGLTARRQAELALFQS